MTFERKRSEELLIYNSGNLIIDESFAHLTKQERFLLVSGFIKLHDVNPTDIITIIVSYLVHGYQIRCQSDHSIKSNIIFINKELKSSINNHKLTIRIQLFNNTCLREQQSGHDSKNCTGKAKNLKRKKKKKKKLLKQIRNNFDIQIGFVTFADSSCRKQLALRSISSSLNELAHKYKDTFTGDKISHDFESIVDFQSAIGLRILNSYYLSLKFHKDNQNYNYNDSNVNNRNCNYNCEAYLVDDKNVIKLNHFDYKLNDIIDLVVTKVDGVNKNWNDDNYDPWQTLDDININDDKYHVRLVHSNSKRSKSEIVGYIDPFAEVSKDVDNGDLTFMSHSRNHVANLRDHYANSKLLKIVDRVWNTENGAIELDSSKMAYYYAGIAVKSCDCPNGIHFSVNVIENDHDDTANSDDAWCNFD